MNIYFVRHGQTTWNAENKVCGITDVPLSEVGVQQAQALAAELALQPHTFGRVIASPLTRAVQTAQILADALELPLTVDDRLREQDYGIYEGVDRGNEAYQANKQNFAFRYPQGESMMQVAVRVYGLLDELKTAGEESDVLLVAHGGICRVGRTYFVDMTNDEFYHFNQPNATALDYLL